MFCELVNRNVEIEIAEQIRGGRDNKIVKTFYKCSGGTFEIQGVKITKPCEMARDERCLLKKM